MGKKIFHIKIAGVGTKEQIEHALRALARQFQDTDEETLADETTGNEDETLIAEWFET
jgi:hypothetical protein